MKTNVVAVTLGVIATLLWALATVGVLNAIYSGALFWALALLLAFLSGVVGGYLTAQRAVRDREIMSALAGGIAGLIALLAAALTSRLAPRTMLAAAFLILLWAIAGRIGAMLITETPFEEREEADA